LAQRTIHYLFGEIFSKQIKIKDKNRFLLGSIMPDAYLVLSDRDSTHYKTKLANQVFFDFNKFREQYHNFIFTDDLYLGYYMHLVEDAFYRQYIYNGNFRMPDSQEEVAVLHNDYHILNSYIVNKYNIQNVFDKFVDLKHEPICEIAIFRINEFLKEMSYDFTEQAKGETYFLKETMLDEFIDKYIPFALLELQSIQNGQFVLQAQDYAWTNQNV